MFNVSPVITSFRSAPNNKIAFAGEKNAVKTQQTEQDRFILTSSPQENTKLWYLDKSLTSDQKTRMNYTIASIVKFKELSNLFIGKNNPGYDKEDEKLFLEAFGRSFGLEKNESWGQIPKNLEEITDMVRKNPDNLMKLSKQIQEVNNKVDDYIREELFKKYAPEPEKGVNNPIKEKLLRMRQAKKACDKYEKIMIPINNTIKDVLDLGICPDVQDYQKEIRNKKD